MSLRGLVMVMVPSKEGYWIDENYARLAEVVKDYDPALELRWIPTDKRTRDDKKPYVIVDTRNEIPVLFANELDTPVDILAKLFEGDSSKNDVLKSLDCRNAATEVLAKKEWLEKLEESHDYAEFLIKSPLNTVIGKDGDKFDSNRRKVGTAKGRLILP